MTEREKQAEALRLAFIYSTEVYTLADWLAVRDAAEAMFAPAVDPENERLRDELKSTNDLLAVCRRGAQVQLDAIPAIVASARADALGEAELSSFDPVKELMREALREIADQHIGDCPASLSSLSGEEWARRCHASLRKIARTALGEKP